MSQYRLPDRLGGIPVTVVDKGPNESGTWRVIVNLEEESFPIWLPPSVLVEIPAPEPANGFVGICDRDVWQRDDEPEEDRSFPAGSHWWRTGVLEPYTYAQMLTTLNGRTMTRLIPDPADSVRDSRITIPTAVANVKLQIEWPTGDGYIPVHLGDFGRALISADGAEQAAAVLLRNAREARAAR